MDYERIYLIYYVYVSLTVALALIGLGKYFCVRALYDLYDKINDELDGALGRITVITSVLAIIAYTVLYLQFELAIAISCTFMVIASAALIFVVLMYSIKYAVWYLKKYHEDLKNKKKMY